MNALVTALQRLGLPLGEMHLLTVTGRKSGVPRTTPVAPITLDGNRYLIGGFPGSHWAANARAAGQGILSRGRRKEHVRFVELSTQQARPVLRAYPAAMPAGVAMMSRVGVVSEGTPDEYEALAGRCAVFRLELLH
ncbi:nitroreductase/quinone reductase family protein [Nonomuraea sp. NPDC049695]|uniref:nitroreductase/quinone reductase family protein n=1 Tax=Nonomuraea sp. NPDC049695 TaxID=3154734 RepID=UPI00343AC8CD